VRAIECIGCCCGCDRAVEPASGLFEQLLKTELSPKTGAYAPIRLYGRRQRKRARQWSAGSEPNGDGWGDVSSLGCRHRRMYSVRIVERKGIAALLPRHKGCVSDRGHRLTLPGAVSRRGVGREPPRFIIAERATRPSALSGLSTTPT